MWNIGIGPISSSILGNGFPQARSLIPAEEEASNGRLLTRVALESCRVARYAEQELRDLLSPARDGHDEKPDDERDEERTSHPASMDPSGVAHDPGEPGHGSTRGTRRRVSAAAPFRRGLRTC